MPHPPERILMTTDTVGGVWTYALTLAEALQPFGVEVALAVMGPPMKDRQHTAAAQLANVEVFESEYALEWMEESWDDVKAAGAWLRALEAQLRPGLVHLNGYAHGALDWQAPALVVGHSCVYSWFEAVKGEAPPPKWRRYRRAVARGLRRADAVTAPTEAMLDALQRHYGPFARTAAIPNGRAAADFPPLEKEPRVLTAGRLWDEAKNIAALQTASPRLSWPVCAAGAQHSPDGDLAAFDPAAYGDIEPLGRLAPPVLAEQMGRAAVFALPARYEPFGLCALEAGLAGCALVLGDIPSLREVWSEAACYVPPDDADALETALRRLIEDEALRARSARRARRRARTYTPERMAEGYLALYGDLLHHAKPVAHAVIDE